MISAEQLEHARRRQQAIRRTAEAIISVGEESGCNLTDIAAEIALLLAFSQRCSQDQAIEMVNRAHAHVLKFLLLMNWDGFAASMRGEAEAAGDTAEEQPKSFEELERDYGSTIAPSGRKTVRRNR